MNPSPPQESAAWARSFLRETLDHWRIAASEPAGLFYPTLDRQWRRLGDGSRTLVSQCRLIYNFCRGYELFGDARYEETARRGLAALHAYFLLAPGRWRWAVTADGREANATPDAYGHAFCLLALSTAARVFHDPALAADARNTWQYLSSSFTDSHGGLIWRLEGPMSGKDSSRSQNPVMHSFEALMALSAIDETGHGAEAIERVLGFLQSLEDFAGGRLLERFTADWTPLSVGPGGGIDLGHAFEWAFLLSDWHRVTGRVALLELGSRFLKTGMEWGLDADGGIFESCAPDGQITASNKGLWQQCEAIRALHRYAVGHGQPHLEEPLHRALAFFRQKFVDEEYGGTFACPAGLGGLVRLDKGDVWKLDYHTVNMCLELRCGKWHGSEEPG